MFPEQFGISRIRMMRHMAAAAAVGLAMPGAPVQASPTGTYTYAAIHPDFGEVGHYTNTITRNGGETKVRVRVNFALRMLFVTVYRFSADSTEFWRNGRLIRYRGNLNDDGRRIQLTGDAKGDKFVIVGPKGRIVAPGGVVPTNPWDIRMTRAPANMSTTTGRVSPAALEKETRATVMLGGRKVHARYVRLKGGHEMWYDQRGVLLRFHLKSRGSVYRFVLRQPGTPSVAQVPELGPADDYD